MAITYTWKITAMKKAPSLDGLSDVITHVNYEYKGVDENGNEGVFNGACPLPGPDKDDFIELKNYVENPAGIGEHGDITDTIAEQISKVAEADDALLVLEENFTVDPKSGKYS